MTVLSVPGRSGFDRIAAARVAALPAAQRPAAAAPAGASAHVTLGGTASGGIAYGALRAVNVAPARFWSAAHDNAVGELMLRNSGPGETTLADRWRGLGGALLQQLAATGTGTTQTLAEVMPAAADDAAAVEGAPDPVAAAAELEAQALSDVATNAVTVRLTVTTRSGRSVDLEIAVNDGMHGGTRGLKVEVGSSGALSDAERDALAALAGALDPALEGLGQAVPQVDLSRLSEFDGAGELAGLELAIENPNMHVGRGALRSFSLQLDGERKALSLKRTDSEMSLSVANSAAGAVDGAQRRSAIDRMLAQIDAAAERSHADAVTTGLFKDAFRQLQAPPPEAAAAAPERDLASQVQALQSGLADFEARFSGRSEKTNRLGGLIEQATTDYRIGQATASVAQPATGGQSVKQVQTEASDAQIQKTRTLLLDVSSGNYDETNIQDRKTVTTLIDTSRTAVVRALRKTEEQRLLAFTSLERQRAVEHRESPLSRSFVERLL
jgi:hypothetical protein